jgi:hypothetical protein
MLTVTASEHTSRQHPQSIRRFVLNGLLEQHPQVLLLDVLQALVSG